MTEHNTDVPQLVSQIDPERIRKKSNTKSVIAILQNTLTKDSVLECLGLIKECYPSVIAYEVTKDPLMALRLQQITRILEKSIDIVETNKLAEGIASMKL